MGYFRNEQEVYEFLGKLFEDMIDDEELFGRFQNADTIVRYELGEPDSTISVKMLAGQAGQVDLGPSGLEPEVIMTMEADTAHRFWLGKVNVTVALARGQIKARGPVTKILKLVPVAKPVFPRYHEQLEAQGRTDLAEVS